MNSLEDIWKSIIQKLIDSEYLTPTAVDSWLADCKPVELGDSTLVIQAPTIFTRNTIRQRFKTQIETMLTEPFSCSFELLVLVDDEVTDYLEEKKTEDVLPPEALNYTFDRFIVGSSNKHAHAAAIAVAENPGVLYNPLFIYGNTGLGKTHLLFAIAHAIRERNPEVNIGYIKGDDFINDMVSSLKQNTAEAFRQRYRNVDLFLVDDIQFIAGKNSTQVEFFHTFETLHQDGRQIVITSDRPPREMAALEDRLRSRFEGGLMTDIQPPDIETRMAIISVKAQRLGLTLPNDVIAYIAESITANIRTMEGVINRLTAYSNLDGESITINSAKRAIKDVVTSGVYIPTPEVIIAETGRYFNIDEKEIRGKNRSKNTAQARHIAMYLMRSISDLTLEETGKQFNRNHTTAMSSVRKIEELISTDPKIADIVRDITANINSKQGE